MIQNKTYYLPFRNRLISGITYMLPCIVCLFLFFSLDIKRSPPDYEIVYFSPLYGSLALLGLYRLLVPIALIRLEEDKIYYSSRIKVDGTEINWQTLFSYELGNVIFLKELKSFNKREEVFVFKAHEFLIPHILAYNSKLNANIVYSGGRTLQDKITLSLRFERFSYEERQKLFMDIEQLIYTNNE